VDGVTVVVMDGGTDAMIGAVSVTAIAVAAAVVAMGDAVAVSAVEFVMLSLVDVGEAAGAFTAVVGVTMLVAVSLMLDDGAGVPDAVVVPVGIGVVLARMGVAPSWAITMSSSASSRPTRRRSVMNEFPLAYERCHSPHRTRAIVLGGRPACLHVINYHN
jgi:hypothetical protein